MVTKLNIQNQKHLLNFKYSVNYNGDKCFVFPVMTERDIFFVGKLFDKFDIYSSLCFT